MDKLWIGCGGEEAILLRSNIFGVIGFATASPAIALARAEEGGKHIFYKLILYKELTIFWRFDK